MPVVRRSRRCVVLLATLVLGGCNGNAVVSSGSPQPAATSTGSARTSALPSAASPTVAPTPSASARLQLEGQIVFEDAGNDFQDTQVWVEEADGSNVRKVVSDDYTDGGVSLSPDGTKVVFYRAKPDSSDIVIANIDGSGLHELGLGKSATPGWNGRDGCDAGPEGDAWSPDGTRVAVTVVCFDAAMNVIRQGLWTIRVDGSGAREVIHHGSMKLVAPNAWERHLEDHRASWSPDGRELVFQRIDASPTEERAAIFTIGVDGKHLRQVTPWELDGNDPVWSPDGDLIAFNASAEPSPTQNIYTIRSDGTGLAKLTTYSEQGQATYHPSWSPDGRQILFSHSPSTGGWADFFVMDRDGGNQQVIAKTTIHENHGTWGRSPTP